MTYRKGPKTLTLKPCHLYPCLQNSSGKSHVLVQQTHPTYSQCGYVSFSTCSWKASGPLPRPSFHVNILQDNVCVGFTAPSANWLLLFSVCRGASCDIFHLNSCVWVDVVRDTAVSWLCAPLTCPPQWQGIKKQGRKMVKMTSNQGWI